MPQMDGTGPTGTGPMGRGLGPCGGGGANQFYRGWGRGFRRGAGFRWNTMDAPSPEEEIQLLEGQKSWLESKIEFLKNQISKISPSNDPGK
jgi:hypothetical protein